MFYYDPPVLYPVRANFAQVVLPRTPFPIKYAFPRFSLYPRRYKREVSALKKMATRAKAAAKRAKSSLSERAKQSRLPRVSLEDFSAAGNLRFPPSSPTIFFALSERLLDRERGNSHRTAQP